MVVMRQNLKNLIWAFGEKALAILLTLISTAAIARYFGVELFGVYQYAMSVFFVATALTWLCPGEVLYSRVRSDGTLENRVIVTSLLYRIFVSFLVFCLVCSYIALTVDDSSKTAFILILCIALLYSEPFGVYRFIMECQGDFHFTAKIRLVAIILKVALILALITLQAHVYFIVAAALFESALMCIFCLYYVRKYYPKIEFSRRYFDFSLVKELLSHGSKLWIGLVCMSVFLKLDRFYLESKLAIDTFGYYAVSLSVLEQLTSLTPMLMAIFAPMMIYRLQGDAVKKNTLRLSIALFAVGVIVATIMFFVAEYFIVMVYGPAYFESVVLFKFVVFVLPLVFFDAPLNAYLIKCQANYFYFIKWLLVALTAFLVLNSTYETEGLYSGFYGYYAGFVMAVIMSCIYFYTRNGTMHADD